MLAYEFKAVSEREIETIKKKMRTKGEEKRISCSGDLAVR
jgi:hypothetical protein